MHDVFFVVRLVENDEISAGYCHDLKLPFVPLEGMYFEQGISTTLWETTTGSELSPAVERVIYDLDNKQFVCLFTVDQPLAASFWQKIDDARVDGGTYAMKFFRNVT